MKSRLWMAAAFALAVPGVLRDVSVYFWKAGPLRTSVAGLRYQALTGDLPADARAAFVTDFEEGGSRYYQALYALAPRILVRDSPASRAERFLVADVRDEARLGQLCAERRMRVVRQGPPGVALLERDDRTPGTDR